MRCGSRAVVLLGKGPKELPMCMHGARPDNVTSVNRKDEGLEDFALRWMRHRPAGHHGIDSGW